MRDNKSILLALLAAGLVITWAYHLYDKSQYSTQTKEVFVKDSSAVSKAVSDSLRVFFIHTLDQLDPGKIQLDSSTRKLSDSAWLQKLRAVNQLRFDIRDILEQKDISQENLEAVKIKIDTLQIRMIELERESTIVNSENQKPKDELTQPNNEVNTQQHKKEELVETKIQLKKNNASSLLLRQVFVLQLIKYNLIKKKLKPHNRTRQINSFRHLR
jgi:hypothetical protein